MGAPQHRQPELGQVVVLNGPPRSGKSSIAAVIQATFDGVWMNIGVDVHARHMTPQEYQPGIGLRPGGERPDLEVLLPALYRGLYDSVAAHSRQGLNVVVDVGHHNSYTAPLHLLRDAARRLAGLPALLVGVRCPVDVIMQRRDATGWKREPPYRPGTDVPEAVYRWDEEVHRPGVYDLEVDTSVLTASECADAIRRRLHGPSPAALRQLRG